MLKKILSKIGRKSKKKQLIKREIKALRRIGLTVAVLALGLISGSGCAMAIGAVRGGIQGAREDIAAAQRVSQQGSKDTYVQPPAERAE